jgi:peptidoglycan/LPS O-acetylase OafA/YrhL
LALFSITKKGTIFLDIFQTEQLKGVAILLVIIGHLWVHVICPGDVPVLGGYAVSLFLILSGFGLTLSVKNKPLILANFIRKKILKIMVPYWIITVTIIFLDYMLLHKTYSFSSILFTLFGMNFTKNLMSMDYSRWYISLLLINYAAFILVNHYLNYLGPLKCIFAIAIVIAVLRVFKVFPLGSIDQIFAFPLGCLIARYYSLVFQVLTKRRFRYAISISIILCIGVTFIVRSYGIQPGETSLAGKIALLFLNSANSMLFCALLIIISMWIGDCGYISRFCLFTGTISYELYLIHGPLLIKYNPIIRLFPVDFIPISFIVFLALIMFCSFIFHSIIKTINEYLLS